MYGLDVSSWNGKIYWNAVKDAGKEFAILRITQRFGIDETFEANYSGAIAAGLKVGVFRYSYASNGDDSAKEARGVLQVLSGRHLDLPVFLDLEDTDQEFFGSDRLQTIIEEFAKVILNAGYDFAIYCGTYWYNCIIPEYAKKKYKFWIGSVPVNDYGEQLARLKPTARNLLGWQYSNHGYVDGIDGDVDLDEFYIGVNEGKDKQMGVTANDALVQAAKWVGFNEADGSHRAIVDIYNGHMPLARGYKVTYTDSWCDVFVSAVFIALGAVDIIGGTECGVEEHVKLFKAAGIWYEDGTMTPKAGDIVVFNWDDNTQPNDRYSDHIGLVESVDAGPNSTIFTTIEGNYNNAVARRLVRVGNGNIRGYARPKYAESVESSIVPAPVPEIEKVTELTHVSKGSYGKLVVLLQKVLNFLGSALEVDGDFGWRTYDAVVAFQSRHDCAVDAVVGEETWTALKLAVKGKIKDGENLLSLFPE